MQQQRVRYPWVSYKANAASQDQEITVNNRSSQRGRIKNGYNSDLSNILRVSQLITDANNAPYSASSLSIPTDEARSGCLSSKRSVLTRSLPKLLATFVMKQVQDVLTATAHEYLGEDAAYVLTCAFDDECVENRSEQPASKVSNLNKSIEEVFRDCIEKIEQVPQEPKALARPNTFEPEMKQLNREYVPTPLNVSDLNLTKSDLSCPAWRIDEAGGKSCYSSELFGNTDLSAQEKWLMDVQNGSPIPQSDSSFSFAPSWLPKDLYGTSTLSQGSDCVLDEKQNSNEDIQNIMTISTQQLSNFRRQVLQLPNDQLSLVERTLREAIDEDTNRTEIPAEVNANRHAQKNYSEEINDSLLKSNNEFILLLLPRITKMLPTRWCVKVLPLVCRSWAKAFAEGILPSVSNVLQLGAASPQRVHDSSFLLPTDSSSLYSIHESNEVLRTMGLKTAQVTELAGKLFLPPLQHIKRWLLNASSISREGNGKSKVGLRKLLLAVPGQADASDFWMNMGMASGNLFDRQEPYSDSKGSLLACSYQDKDSSEGKRREEINSEWLTGLFNLLSLPEMALNFFLGSIEVLSLAGIEYVKDHHLAQIATSTVMINLKHLDLCDCTSITDIGIEALYGSLKAQKILLNVESILSWEDSSYDYSSFAGSYPSKFSDVIGYTGCQQSLIPKLIASGKCDPLDSKRPSLGSRLLGLRLANCYKLTPHALKIICGLVHFGDQSQSQDYLPLQTLCLAGCRDMGGRLLGASLNHLTELKVLSLRGLRLTAQFLEAMSSPVGTLEGGVFGKLEWLSFAGTYISDRDLEDVLGLLWHSQKKHANACGLSSTCLRSISLADLPQSVTDRVLSRISPLIGPLKSVDLSGARRVTDSGVSSLFLADSSADHENENIGDLEVLKVQSSIQEFSLTNAIGVTDKSFNTLILQCRSLKYLRMARTGVVTPIPSVLMNEILEALKTFSLVQSEIEPMWSPQSNLSTLSAGSREFSWKRLKTEGVIDVMSSGQEDAEEKKYKKCDRYLGVLDAVRIDEQIAYDPTGKHEDFANGSASKVSILPDSIECLPLPWTKLKNETMSCRNTKVQARGSRNHREPLWRADYDPVQEINLQKNPIKTHSSDEVALVQLGVSLIREHTLLRFSQRAGQQLNILGHSLISMDLTGCSIKCDYILNELCDLITHRLVNLSNKDGSASAQEESIYRLDEELLLYILPFRSLQSLNITLVQHIPLSYEKTRIFGEYLGLLSHSPPLSGGKPRAALRSVCQPYGLKSLHASCLSMRSYLLGASQSAIPNGASASTIFPFISGFVSGLYSTRSVRWPASLANLALEKFCMPYSRQEGQALQFAILDIIKALPLCMLSFAGSDCISDIMIADLHEALQLSPSPGLQCLNISSTNVSDVGIARLFQKKNSKVSALDSIYVLQLQDLQLVTDAALRSIMRWAKSHSSELFLLDVEGTAVTLEGILQIQTESSQIFPNLRCICTSLSPPASTSGSEGHRRLYHVESRRDSFSLVLYSGER